MRAPFSAPRRLSFGPFEADLHSGELLKFGIKIRLQAQPFQLLVMLLERPGELVTRDQICAKLWPADTFVDFDRSLGTALNKIREVLNDSAAEPRFVETLPRRGYRFIAPVTAVESDPEPPPPVADLAQPPARGRFFQPAVGISVRSFINLYWRHFVEVVASEVEWPDAGTVDRSSSPVESVERSGAAIFRGWNDRRA